MEVQLTPNFKIVGIEANVWDYDEHDRAVTTTFAICFSYFEQSGFLAYLPADRIQDEDPSWAMAESECGDLHDSFMSQLDEYWDEIKMACAEWEIENLKSQTETVD